MTTGLGSARTPRPSVRRSSPGPARRAIVSPGRRGLRARLAVALAVRFMPSEQEIAADLLARRDADLSEEEALEEARRVRRRVLAKVAAEERDGRERG